MRNSFVPVSARNLVMYAATGAVLATLVASAPARGEDAAAAPVVQQAADRAAAPDNRPGGSPIELAPDAPDRHVVVRGDTLWDIAGRFLRKPWRWPEIWEMNRAEIRDPHWIYPGDVIVLDRSGPTPRLRLAHPVGENAIDTSALTGGAGLPIEKRSPDVRTQELGRDAIPTISSAEIAPFLNRPLIVDERGLDAHPRIVATQDGRLNLGTGDLGYVRGMTEDGDAAATAAGSRWQVYRPARPLVDPDTRRTIAWEALYLGSGQIEQEGDPAAMRIVAANEEIGTGDRLMPAERRLPVIYTPHAPDSEVSGRIVAVYRGLSQVGRNNVVALSVGADDGIERGHVLDIRQRGRSITDRTNGRAERIVLPSQSIGHLLVFRVFDKIAYGLVMDASQPISVGDDVATP